MHETTTQALGGVKINLVSRTFFETLGAQEKVHYILDEVSAGKILVLEQGLTAAEEAKLIEATMGQIDQDRFIGIEMQSYHQDAQGRWQRLLHTGRRARPRMVVVGPADRLRTVSKDNNSIQAEILSPAGAGVGG